MALHRHRTTTERSLTEYSLDAPLLTFDIPTLLAQLKHEDLWRTGKRNAMTLLKDRGLRVVLIVMHASTAIPSHQNVARSPAPNTTTSTETRLTRAEYRRSRPLRLRAGGRQRLATAPARR